ncbi:MAG: tRNA 2-thiouridine(34) synthase MnmA [Ndongobacter sp.]|nr:tRNA 2-thiouridine(34) synthase MnmA [Ndongobacter sp.]
MKKAFVAMSGGVDSSIACYDMLQAGFNCIGVTLCLHDFKIQGQKGVLCGSAEDARDAAAVCRMLGIPHELMDQRTVFADAVVRPFIEIYERAGTPNPCLLCNRHLKFGALLRAAQERGFDTIATGHYARVEWDAQKERFLLKKGLDETKDQSYVLYMLTQKELAHIVLPLGKKRKADIREQARSLGFQTANKPDSQDICFVPDGDYASFIQEQRGTIFPPGDFLDTQGRVIGTHKGIIHYTIGQRRGLGIAAQEPLYVLDKDAQKNTVTLGPRHELGTRSFVVDELNLISCDALDRPASLSVKIRYRQQEQPATVEQIAPSRARVTFAVPQNGVAPGQAAVFYLGDTVVGGGIISSQERVRG